MLSRNLHEIKVALVLNGDLKPFEKLKQRLQDFDYVLSADGASNVLFEINFLPNAIIGDLDSITKQNRIYFEQNNVEFFCFSPEKDFTDSHLALEKLICAGAKEITIFGAMGSRWDHSLANVGLCYYALQNGVRLHFYGNQTYMTCLKKGTYLFAKKEKMYFSLLALFGEVKGLSVEGAKYLLDAYTLRQGETIGISNEFRDDISISFQEGILLVIETEFEE